MKRIISTCICLLAVATFANSFSLRSIGSSVFGLSGASGASLSGNNHGSSGRSSHDDFDDDDLDKLVYPKNSILEAFFLNLRPNEKVNEELRNLKYPSQSLLGTAVTNISKFASGVRSRAQGFLHDVRTQPGSGGLFDFGRIGTFINSFLKFKLGTDNVGGDVDHEGQQHSEDNDNFFGDPELDGNDPVDDNKKMTSNNHHHHGSQQQLIYSDNYENNPHHKDNQHDEFNQVL